VAEPSFSSSIQVTGDVVAAFGNSGFTAGLIDGDQATLRASDAYGVTVLDTPGRTWHQVGTPLSPMPLGGGNVAIKSTLTRTDGGKLCLASTTSSSQPSSAKVSTVRARHSWMWRGKVRR